MLENYSDVLTVKEAQTILKVGRNAIYQLIHDNKIKHIRIGNKIIIPKQNLIDYLQSA